MHTVVIHRRAARYLKKLPQDQLARIKNVLNQMKTNPFGLPGIKAMSGDWSGYHRLRIGNIRVIFLVDENRQTVYVDHIGPRGDIYKGSS
jgi:mRNA interferase RelE/StbE